MIITKKVFSLLPLLLSSLSRQAGLNGAPPHFLLAWIQAESGGDYANRTGREFGLFQVHHEHAADLGWSNQKFEAVTSSPLLSMTYGLESVASNRAHIDQKLRRAGADPATIDGYWYFVKLQHGLPLIANVATSLFKKERRRPPHSFAEAAAFVRAVGARGPGSYLDTRPRGGKDRRASVRKVLANAEKVGSFAYLPLPTEPADQLPDDQYITELLRFSPAVRRSTLSILEILGRLEKGEKQ